MKSKFALLVFLILIFFSYNAFAINTYIGVKIESLTDSSGLSCANQATNDQNGILTNYGPQGRIRALSSILPGYPIHFKVTDTTDSSIVWEGDSTKNIDYMQGDTIYIPTSLNLNLGVTYNLFFDIDAVMVYLPFFDYEEFRSSPNNLYWTVGHKGTGTAHEIYIASDTNGNCNYQYSQGNTDQANLVEYSNYRYNLGNSCWNDGVAMNCDEQGMIGVLDMMPGCCWMEFRTRGQYDYLYQDNKGNVELNFTLS